MPRKDPELCGKIRDRVEKWDKEWSQNRKYYYKWIDFVLGNQWREDESKLFERYNKVPLTSNKLGTIANHIIGDQIQNTPNLQISPEEDCDVEYAQVRAALVKNISLNSDAKTVYQTAFWQALIGGYSAFALKTDYVNDESFDQEILIYDYKDPNHCYWDIQAKHVTKTDGMFSGYKTRMSRKAVRDKWGKEVERDIGSSWFTEDSTTTFADDDSITVINDYEKEKDTEHTAIYKLSDGSMINSKEFKELEKIKVEGRKGKVLIKDGFPVTVLEKRDVVRYKVKHRQIAGDYVLEETDFSGRRPPILFLDQKSFYDKNGKQITRSFFKDVEDNQKYLNYLLTQSAYITKISRYDQFIMPRKCAATPDSQEQWRDPSVVRGAVYYDETPSGARPEQLKPPELSQSLLIQYEKTLMDIQTGTGVFDTQLGEKGNEVSGVAISKRNNSGSKNVQIPKTALEISIATLGEMVNEMIPFVYDTERTIVIPMADSQEQRVNINKPMDEYGMGVENDMTKGRFKIRLKPGLSYEGQKEEALQSLQSVFAADRTGTTFNLLGDLYAENLPLDNNMEIRNRLRTMVPPEVIEAGKTGKPLPPKPQEPSPEQQMLQLKQQELQMKAQEAEREAQTKVRELDLKQQEMQRKAIETHQDMTIAWERLEAEKQEAAAELQSAILRYQAEGERIGADLQISHSQNLIRLLTHQPKHFDQKNIVKQV